MHHTILTKLISSAITLAVAAAPATALAKGNPHARSAPGAPATPGAAAQNCARAFGHLIAPGWLKKNGTTSIDTRCALPVGIATKLGLDGTRPHATSTRGTNDVTSPTIYWVQTRVGTTTATISWYTNERATTQVRYGATSSYSASTTLDTALTYRHRVTLTGLTPGATYHVKLESKDKNGNLASSADRTITLKSLPDSIAPTLANIAASNIGSTTAKISWTTNENATGKVYYSSAATFNTNTASTVATTSLSTSHSFNLSGLSASTTYRYLVESKDATGNVSTSSLGSFVTGL